MNYNLLYKYIKELLSISSPTGYIEEVKKYEGTLQNIKPSISVYAEESKQIERSLENYKIVIDEEVFCKKDINNLGIDVGDIVSFDTRTKITSSWFIKSRYLDDNSAVDVILYVIDFITLNKISLNHTINFLFINYEEVGHGSIYIYN